MKRILTVLFCAALGLIAAEDIADKAIALEKQGKYLEAVKLYEKLTTEEPDNEYIWIAIGRCYRYQGEHMRSLSMYLKASQIVTNDASIWLEVGKTYRYLHDNANAALMYEKAAQCETNNDKKKVYLKDAGNIYFEMESFEKAKKAIRAAIAIDPNYSMAFNNLASIYIVEHNYSNAIRVLEKAFELDPDNTLPLLNLILVYAYQKNAVKCNEYASKALSMESPSPQYIHLYLAVLHVQLGDKPSWKAQLELAFKKDKLRPFFDEKDDFKNEYGFDPVRNDVDFKALVTSYFMKR
ncbi:MAG: tetratricopeptide repeat protein [Spirochaetes bacterium]|nr:tetratricopeptide repeat protein [Spirochaetota bacterium]